MGNQKRLEKRPPAQYQVEHGMVLATICITLDQVPTSLDRKNACDIIFQEGSRLRANKADCICKKNRAKHWAARQSGS